MNTMKKLLYPLFIVVFIVFSMQVSATICYQESMNVSNQTGIDGGCGLNYSGFLETNCSSFPLALNRLYDGDWGTSSFCSDTSWATINITYYLPNTSLYAVPNLLWQVKYTNPNIGSSPTENITIPSTCINSNYVKFAQYGNYSNTTYYCYNSTGGMVYLFNVNKPSASTNTWFEESVYWNVSLRPIINNVSITPTTAYKNDTLQIWCNSSSDNPIQSFNYSCFKNDVLNTSGATDNDFICYQESANTTNQTGIDGSCNINYSGAYFPEVKASDQPDSGLFYINYSKPNSNNFTLYNAIYTIKAGDPTSGSPIQNISVPSPCLNQNTLQIKLEGLEYGVGETIRYGHCYNGSSWQSFLNYTKISSSSVFAGTKPDNSSMLFDGNWSSYARYGLSATSSNNGSWISEDITPVRLQIFEEGIYWNVSQKYLSNISYNIANVSSFFVKNDNISCSCSAYDGISYSNWLNSSILTISNSLPILQQTYLTPQSIFSGDILYGFCNASDLDDDGLTYEYILYKNNVSDSTGGLQTCLDSDTNNGDGTCTKILQTANTDIIDDIYVEQFLPNKNNGAATSLSTKDHTSEARRIYIKFNTSSISNLTIISANINLYKTYAGTTGTQSIYQLYNDTWDESAVTWNLQPTPISAVLNSNSGSSDIGFTSWNVTEVMSNSALYNNLSTSFLIKTDETGVLDSDAYASKENTNTTIRPYLNVTYQLDYSLPNIDYNIVNISNLLKNEEYILSCEAFDGSGNSSWLNSSTITVSNSPPTFNESNFYVYSNHTVNLSIQINGSDIDGDSLNYSMSVLPYLSINQTTGVLTMINNVSSVGNYNATINVTDGSSMTSMWVFFSINNTVPTSVVNILNKPLADSQNITANISIFDIDSDVIVYNETRWYLNGTYNSSFDNLTEINNSYTLDNETWIISARVYDGANWSDWDNGSVVIGDTTAPTINRLYVSSSSVLTTDTLTIYANLSDSGGFGETACIFTLTKSNQNLGLGIGLPFNFTTELKNGDLVYREFTSDTFTAGTLEFTKAYCSDLSTNSANNLTVSINITISTPTIPGDGGGGGEGDTIIISGTNLTFLYDPVRLDLTVYRGWKSTGQFRIINKNPTDAVIRLSNNVPTAMTLYTVGNIRLLDDTDLKIPTTSGLTNNYVYIKYVIDTNLSVGAYSGNVTLTSGGKLFDLPIVVRVKANPFDSEIIKGEFFGYDICKDFDCENKWHVSLTPLYAIIILIIIALIVLIFVLVK